MRSADRCEVRTGSKRQPCAAPTDAKRHMRKALPMRSPHPSQGAGPAPFYRGWGVWEVGWCLLWTTSRAVDRRLANMARCGNVAIAPRMAGRCEGRLSVGRFRVLAIVALVAGGMLASTGLAGANGPAC